MTRWEEFRAAATTLFLLLACWLFAATLEELASDEPKGRSPW